MTSDTSAPADSASAAPAAVPSNSATTPAATAAWAVRNGHRDYTGHSARGGIVAIGDASIPGTFTPGELLKVALAACAGFSSEVALSRRLGDDFAARIVVDGPSDPAEDRYPQLSERFELDLSGLDEDARTRLLTVVTRAVDKACTVGRTLKHGAAIELSLDDPSVA